MDPTFKRFRGTFSYLTSDALEAAVNCALALEKPLLVKGEPGTGKTLLAEALASALEAPLLTWHVKSTTRAQDGLYVYDTVARLYDSRFGDGDVKDIRRYIKYGPLGESFRAPQRVVLLIDEVVALQRPVVVITSNNEKDLPDAFLRRCVFHFIDFPEQELMRRIVGVHHPDVDRALVDQCLSIFFEIRAMSRIRKRPSTSELVDWIAVLQRAGVTSVKLDREMPFLGALLKKEQDLVAFADQLSGGKKYRS